MSDQQHVIHLTWNKESDPAWQLPLGTRMTSLTTGKGYMIKKWINKFRRKNTDKQIEKFKGFQCGVCDKWHDELPLDIGYKRSFSYFEVPENERVERVLESDFFCKIDEGIFVVRGLIYVPLNDYDDEFCWGVWVKVDKEIYDIISDQWESDSNGVVLEGVLDVDILTYDDSYMQTIEIHLQGPNEQPRFILKDKQSKLGQEQSNGIIVQRVLEINHQVLSPEGSFKFEEPMIERCDCCENELTRLTRFVYKNDDAYAVYYAQFVGQHDEKAVYLLIGMGEWGEDDSPEKRTAFAVKLWNNDEGYVVSLMDRADSPWHEVEYLGTILDREEVLVHPLKSQVFELTDKMVERDKLIKNYLE